MMRVGYRSLGESLCHLSLCASLSLQAGIIVSERMCVLCASRMILVSLPRPLWREDARGEEREEEEDEGTMDCGAPQEWVKDEIEEVGGFTAAFSSPPKEKNRWKRQKRRNGRPPHKDSH